MKPQKVNRGDHVFVRGGTTWKDRPLPTTIPFIVVNVAACEGNDAVLVVREASMFKQLTADGMFLDRTHGILLSLNEVASIEPQVAA